MDGRVQGVGFRWWTRKAAAGLGLRGRVRNLADGTVEVHAMGPSDALDTLESRLRDGPGPAKVASIERLDVGSRLGEEASRWNSFEIERG